MAELEAGLEAEMGSLENAADNEPDSAISDHGSDHTQTLPVDDIQDGDTSIVFADGTDWTHIRKGKKRQKVSSSGASLETFKSLNIHEKLTVLHSDIQNQNEKVANIEQKVDTCLRLHTRVNTIEANLGDADRRLLLLEYKTIDLESRGRRNNLLFNGFDEERLEICEMKIESFLERALDVERVVIDRAHRLGRYTRGSHRPIIVAFRDYATVEAILSNAHKLKGKTISINRDFPKEIVAARKSLWKLFKDLKRDYPNSKVSMVYPAKIKKDGQVIEDAFPRWNEIMSGSRILINQRPQTVGNSNAQQRDPRAPFNTRPGQTDPADSAQVDPLTAHAPNVANPNNAASAFPVSPVRSNTPRRQDRSRSPPRRNRSLSDRSRPRARYQVPPNFRRSHQESPIHRPWSDPNDHGNVLPELPPQDETR